MRVCFLLLLCGCSAAFPPPTTTRVVGPSQVQSLLNQHECHTCHSLEAVFGATSRANGERVEAPRRAAPTLASMERFRAQWLRRFLADPSPVRPRLAQRMPRPERLGVLDIEVLIEGWGAEEDARGEGPGPSSPSGARLAQGAARFAASGCGSCHGPDGTDELAPDLRHARERLSRVTLARWIRDPAAVKPTTTMPPTGLDEADAELLADFVYFAGAGALPAPDGAPRAGLAE
ncbi:MAG: cytochrome c [Myxococcales bacterium]|nr:cytochrome c [Myxococcales bacterium]